MLSFRHAKQTSKNEADTTFNLDPLYARLKSYRKSPWSYRKKDKDEKHTEKLNKKHQRVAYYLWTYVFDMACYSSTLKCRDETFFGKKTSYPSPPILRNFNDVPLIPFNLNPVPGTEGY